MISSLDLHKVTQDLLESTTANNIMVFESLVVDLMNRYLGEYIENLDASQLKLGIWGGDAVLENLHVKGDALKDLDLPVEIKSGFIGKLTLKIPWKNLYKAPVEATLDSLYLLAVPNSSVEYDAKKEAEKAQKAKQTQLQDLEEQLLKRMEKKDTAPKADGFVEKLATQIVKNIQVHISNIHVRYEDDSSVPDQPFALGITLHGLSVETTDSNWMPCILDETVKIIYKMVSLKSLAIYWNSKPNVLYTKLPRAQQLEEFKNTIANGGFLPENFTFVIKPITLTAKLRMNPHPENDLSTPKILLAVVLQEVGLHLSCLQFHDMIQIVESMDRMSVNAPFRKFKPNVPVKGNAKAWWKYAYNSIIEASVSHRSNMWSWNHIKEHRRKVRAYKKLYKEKLKQKKPPQDLLDKLMEMENDIDVFNITLARQTAEVELSKSGLSIKSKKSVHQIEEKKSWFGGWFGGGKKEEKVEESTIDEVMGDTEKNLLYEAIGYTEGEGPVDTQFPKEYVELKLDVALKKVSVNLQDDKNLSGATILNLLVNDINTTFKQRPAAKAISVETKLFQFTVDGLAQNGDATRIISSDLSAEADLPVSVQDKYLLCIEFETNPLQGNCDQRVMLKARPLQIVYDALSINSLIQFFQPPDDIQLQQLRAAAAAAYEEIKDQTATGLQHAMETHTISNIDVTVMSSFIVIPKDGRYTDGCEALIVDMGEIIFSSLTDDNTGKAELPIAGNTESLDLEKMRSQAYDKFAIEVKNIQVLLADKGDDWILNRTLQSSPLHILDPFTVSLVFQKCMITNDASLPKIKLNGELLVLSLNMSDTKLHNMLSLVNSIPLPPSSPPSEIQLVDYETWNFDGIKREDMKSINNVFEDQYSSTPSLSSGAASSDEFYTAESDFSDSDENLDEKLKRKQITKLAKLSSKQLTEVEAVFMIGKISLGLSQSTPDGERNILELVIKNFGVHAAVRTWDTSVALHLGSICVEYMQGKLPDGQAMYILHTPALEKASKLLTVEVLIAKRNSPEFTTTYASTEQKISVKFSMLEINANSKALLEIKEFAEKMIPVSENQEITPVSPDESKTTFVTASDDMSSGSFPKKSSPKKRKHDKPEIINVKLEAMLDTFAVNLSDENRLIASVAVEGISTDITILPDRTCVAAKLHNLLVIDPLEESLYNNIVSAEGDDVLVVDVVNYNDATSGDAYSDMDNVDIIVSLKLGSIRIVFVKRFIDTMVKFGANFQDVKEAAIETGSKAQEAASEKVKKLAERNPRIRLNINLSVPKIFIPKTSKSLEVVAADLGNVKVTNYFTIVGEKESDIPAVCENMKVEVTDIKVALCQLNDIHSITSEYQVLEPVSVSVDLKRNLAASWYHGVPDIEINGSMHAINIKMSEADLMGIMKTLNENMSELDDTTVETQQSLSETSGTGTSVKTSTDEIKSSGSKTSQQSNAVHDALKLRFALPSIRINLYLDLQRELPLTKFLLQNLGVDMRMGADGSMDITTLLEGVSMEDMRINHQGGITKFIEKNAEDASVDDKKNVIHASIIQKSDGAMDVNAAVESLKVILCVEFILKITDFFLNSMPKESVSTVAVQSDEIVPQVAQPVSSDQRVDVSQSESTESTADEQKSKAICVRFKLHETDVILVTDIKSTDPEALILKTKVEMKFDISPDGTDQVLSGSVSKLQITSCPFATIHNVGSEKKIVLAPCDINVSADMSEVEQNFSVSFTKIRITASPIVIQTISEVLGALSPQSESEVALIKANKQVKADIWDDKNVHDMNLWFIEKPEEELKERQPSGMFGVVSSVDFRKKASTMSETLKLAVPDIMIRLECGHGHHTVPLLITELKVYSEIRDWSGGKMNGKFNLSLGVIYFNESLSVWEPLVEPVEQNPGELHSEHKLWKVVAEIQQNVVKEESKRESIGSEEDLEPVISVSVMSENILQTTITNAALKVVDSLSRAFSDATMSKGQKRKEIGPGVEKSKDMVSAAASIVNMFNTALVVTLGKEVMVIGETGLDKSSKGEYTLQYKDYLAVDFRKDENAGIWTLLSDQQKFHHADGSVIHVSLPGSADSATFDISKTGSTMYKLTNGVSSLHLLCIVDSKGGIRTVTLRSSIAIFNHLSGPLEVLDKNKKVLHTVTPNGTFPLPTEYSEKDKLFVKPTGKFNVKETEIHWQKFIKQDQFLMEEVIECAPDTGSSNSVNLNIEVVSEQIESRDMNDTCYEIHVRPVAVLRNFFPFKIEFKEDEMKTLTAGSSQQLHEAKLNKSELLIRIPDYRNASWIAKIHMEPNLPELSVLTFRNETNSEKYMEMGEQVTYLEGFMQVTLYSPYWMINETGFPLDYRASEENIIQHPEEKQDFILFSFTSKSFFSKNKVQLRVCNSNFSDSFTIDAVGSNGTITCKTKDFNYIVGIKIRLTSFGLTKIVTFTSYYTIVNKSSKDLGFVEEEDVDNRVVWIDSKTSSMFWPESKTDRLKICLKDKKDIISVNLRYSKLDSGVLVKVGDDALFFDVSVTESSVTITVKDYYVGSSAVLIVNHTSDLNLSYGQLKVGTKSRIEPGNVKHFLWPEPTAKREVSWRIEEGGKEISLSVFQEQAGVLKFKVNNKERVVHYTVFVDGLQRVLLITEDENCAQAVELGLGAEQPNMEVNVSLQGLACSITDNKAKREVMYMAITSSGIVWEEKPKRRWKALALKYGSVLEENYQKTNQTSGTIEVEKHEFDTAKMKILKPYKAELRRFFSPGIWLQYTVCDHQNMLHAKINRMQVDNQLPAAVFPVVLHPIPLPKTIAIDSSPKPFIEVSLMQRTSEHQTFTHIKYFKILVQEFSIKLDMGFITALLPVFGANEVKSTPERDLKYFLHDVQTAKKVESETDETMQDASIMFFDVLHLSPIKVHVSFSMQNTCYDDGNQKSNVVVLPFNALAVVLKSIGVTVSDIDDVVFKLGYFGRDYLFFSAPQLQKAVTMHYAGQGIKQLYVLVFGLDVIGNPYGLVMGIAEGVTDLFYEPYQGMIQGPGEFVEGLALGAMSLLGHTVGGAAGAVSRVTGALGKGIATMTMDDEYKKKRQMEKNKPADLKEGLARGGKGLVMGVVGGITGVITKPVEGAKKEGAAGFFKGVGKGIIGVVARPASGVIDLASNTFEGIQKLADMSEEVKKLRPARWIDDETGILQPYVMRKAQGKAILLETEKGKYETEKYIDHVPLDKDKKSFLMLTKKMIMEVHKGEIFGQWNSGWKYDYEEIAEEPQINKEGLKLAGAKHKKLFSSKSHSRTVTFYNQVYAQHVLKRIQMDWALTEKKKPAKEAKESKRGHSLSFSRKSKH